VTYRLLALDLDGTLIGADMTIPDETVAAAAAAQQRGLHITLATGRTFRATRPFAERLGIDDAVICYQGGVIRHVRTGEIDAIAPMPADLAIEAIRLMEAAGLFVLVYFNERIGIRHEGPELEQYMRFHPEGIDAVVAPDLAALAAVEPVIKLQFMAEPAVVDRELPPLAAHFAGRLGALRSHTIFGELTVPGVSKGAALETLAARLGIPREEVIAIGDHENDLPMIAWAGLGLAMGNAIPAVRQAADAVIPPVEEAGVAWAIRHYVLKER
jgi:Cof subfamily protein (haloacid dehalogenase superfamily)